MPGRCRRYSGALASACTTFGSWKSVMVAEEKSTRGQRKSWGRWGWWGERQWRELRERQYWRVHKCMRHDRPGCEKRQQTVFIALHSRTAGSLNPSMDRACWSPRLPNVVSTGPTITRSAGEARAQMSVHPNLWNVLNMDTVAITLTAPTLSLIMILPLHRTCPNPARLLRPCVCFLRRLNQLLSFHTSCVQFVANDAPGSGSSAPYLCQIYFVHIRHKHHIMP